jgi:hypothetical protein
MTLMPIFREIEEGRTEACNVSYEISNIALIIPFLVQHGTGADWPKSQGLLHKNGLKRGKRGFLTEFWGPFRFFCMECRRSLLKRRKGVLITVRSWHEKAYFGVLVFF